MLDELRQSGVPEDATVGILHHEELRAHQAVIAREVQHLWNRYVRARKGLHDAEFTINRMGRFQQFPRWFRAQHIFRRTRAKQICWIGLTI